MGVEMDYRESADRAGMGRMTAGQLRDMQLRQARGLPFLHAGLHPPGDQLDITVLQTP